MPNPFFRDLPSVVSPRLALVSADADPRGGRLTLGSEKLAGLHPWATIRPFRDSADSEGVHLVRKGLAFHDDGAPFVSENGFVWTVSNGGQMRALAAEDSAGLGFDLRGGSGLTFFESFDAEDIQDRGDGYFEAGEYGLVIQGDIQAHYQPPENEFHPDGTRRMPVEMAGGYCLYHGSKVHNRHNAKGDLDRVYMAGKVGDLLRPFGDCFTASGVLIGRVFGKWEIRGDSWFKLIPVNEIPLETARIDVDATLGYTSAGASWINYLKWDPSGSFVAATEGGTLVSYHGFIQGNGTSQMFRFYFYRLSSGTIQTPTQGALVASCSAFAATPPASGAWLSNSAVGTEAFSSGNSYGTFANTDNINMFLRCDAISTIGYGLDGGTNLPTSGDPHNPMSISIQGQYKTSTYVTYTPAASGPPLSVLENHYRKMRAQ